jgi:hypothetical protein
VGGGGATDARPSRHGSALCVGALVLLRLICPATPWVGLGTACGMANPMPRGFEGRHGECGGLQPDVEAGRARHRHTHTPLPLFLPCPPTHTHHSPTHTKPTPSMRVRARRPRRRCGMCACRSERWPRCWATPTPCAACSSAPTWRRWWPHAGKLGGGGAVVGGRMVMGGTPRGGGGGGPAQHGCVELSLLEKAGDYLIGLQYRSVQAQLQHAQAMSLCWAHGPPFPHSHPPLSPHTHAPPP